MSGKRVNEITRGVRNKNPFNIRFSNNSWLGKIRTGKKDKDFEEFRSIEYGIRAGIQLLRGYIAHGYDTITAIINRFAPSKENNTLSYISYVSNVTCIDPGVTIRCNSIEFFKICAAICAFESRYDLSKDMYNSVLLKFRLFGNLV